MFKKLKLIVLLIVLVSSVSYGLGMEKNIATAIGATFNITSATTNQRIIFDGSDWVNDYSNFLTASDGNPDSSALFVTADGKVGIGTSNPQTVLHVYEGSITVDDAYLNNMVYAAMGASYNITATVLGSVDVYVTVTENVQIYGPTKNISFSNGVITVLKDGVYKLSLTASFVGGNNDEYHGGISLNGTNPAGDMEFRRKMGVAAAYGTVAAGGVRQLSINDTIELKVENDTDNDDPTFSNWSLSAIKIAP